MCPARALPRAPTLLPAVERMPAAPLRVGLPVHEAGCRRGVLRSGASSAGRQAGCGTDRHHALAAAQRPAAFSIAIGFVLAAFAALEYVVTQGTHEKLLELAARLRVRDRSVRYPARLGPGARWVRPGLVGGEDVYHRHEDDAAMPPRTERAPSDAEEDAAGGDSDSNDSVRSEGVAQPDAAAAAARGPSLYDSVLHLRDFWRRNM